MESFRFSDINWEFHETFKIIKKVPLIDGLEVSTVVKNGVSTFYPLCLVRMNEIRI